MKLSSEPLHAGQIITGSIKYQIPTGGVNKYATHMYSMTGSSLMFTVINPQTKYSLLGKGGISSLWGNKALRTVYREVSSGQ